MRVISWYLFIPWLCHCLLCVVRVAHVIHIGIPVLFIFVQGQGLPAPKDDQWGHECRDRKPCLQDLRGRAWWRRRGAARRRLYVGPRQGREKYKACIHPHCHLSHTIWFCFVFLSLQPTNFTNPVYATLYMGAHNSRNSLASTDEKKELLSRGDEEPLVDPLA